jgi:hypothetical protein
LYLGRRASPARSLQIFIANGGGIAFSTLIFTVHIITFLAGESGFSTKMQPQRLHHFQATSQNPIIYFLISHTNH